MRIDARHESAPAAADVATRDRWSEAKKSAFKLLSPAAVYVAGNEGPEPRYFGDNMGAWPIMLGITTCWRDTITPQMDRFSPHRPRGVLFRLWTGDRHKALALQAGVEGLIRDRVEQMRHSWLDFGVGTDVSLFELECHDVASRLDIEVWSDEAIDARLDRMVEAAMRRVAEQRRRS